MNESVSDSAALALAAAHDRGANRSFPVTASTPSAPRHFPLSRLARAAARGPALALVGLIRLYQRTLSPALPVLTLGGCACRFSPTCSHYAAEAIRVHGAFHGVWLAFRRLLKCAPLHPGGLDPVPPRADRLRPACRNVS